MDHAAKRWHGAIDFLQGVNHVLAARDIAADHADLRAGGFELAYALLGLGAVRAVASHERQVSRTLVDEPPGRRQSEAAQAARDEIGSVGVCHGRLFGCGSHAAGHTL